MRAIIIEDEIRSQKVLESMVQEYCPHLQVLGFADSVASGLKLIDKVHPELIFLDVQLKEGTGFEILEQLGDLSVSVIFTTAFDKYAIKAFRFSAVDYLIKPIESSELIEAVTKCKQRNSTDFKRDKIEGLLHNLNLRNNEEPILSISTSESIEFVKVYSIIRCEAQGAYCFVYLNDKRKIVVSKIIKELESLLTEYKFFRIHQSHLINLNEIQKYLKNDNLVVMRDGNAFPLARSRKKDFLDELLRLRV